MTTLESVFTLKSGCDMPVLGFGVYQSTDALSSCKTALKEGYRHIDTARVYKNEEACCAAVKFWKENGGTGDIFLTTKLVGRECPADKCKAAVEQSVERAAKYGLKWDLFLLHDPTAGPEKRLEAWRVLEDAVARGEIRAIGVSNFSDIHLEEFKKAGVKIKPDVNQIEVHPWCQQRGIVEYCKREGIVVQAYCPLVRTQRVDDPVLQAISKKHNKTWAQVLIRWSLQHGFSPLPKSDHPERIRENREVYNFKLDKEDMAELDALDEGRDGAISWNPTRHM
ncbi:2,5-diketo-D-gluconic acid reductase A [Meredithblackwellia eburnea MCA 4105]